MSRDKAYALCKLYVALRDSAATGDPAIDQQVTALRSQVTQKLVHEGQELGVPSATLIHDFEKQKQAQTLWQ